MSPLEIAIVGMGCRSAGAPDLFAYWENLLAGRHDPLEPTGPALADVVAAGLADAGQETADLDGERVKSYDARGDLPGGMSTSSWAWRA